jgi:predicted acyltransferase
LNIPATPNGAPGPGAIPKKKRLASLDAFRGLTIALMIVVNCPGDPDSVFSFLGHSAWNGWTFADTVFPSFIFIVGVSLVFSFAKRDAANNTSIWENEFRVLRRTLVLFALGLFLNIFPAFHVSNIRIPGVLQRIAICYFFTSLIVLKAGLRGRILWLIATMASYWLMMRFIPVPGIGTGVMEPGENFASWVDSIFLKGHMWSYYDNTWDPEGIISTIPAISTTLFGVLTGQWLMSSASEGKKVAGLICAGLILLAAGSILDYWMPINKSIWTSSFSIFMAGLALVFLAIFHLFIDVVGISGWAKPFIILGLNPITIYVLSQILDNSLRSMDLIISKGNRMTCQDFLFHQFCIPYAEAKTASLLYALGILICMLLVAWIMWRKRLFIKV